MKRRVVILSAGSTIACLGGCVQFPTESTPTTMRSTTDPTTPCGDVSAENVRIDSRSNESHEIRVELRQAKDAERTKLEETRTVPAADEDTGSATVWIEDAVESEGTYVVDATLDSGASETYQWHVSDGCDDLGIEITPDGELQIGVLPEG